MNEPASSWPRRVADLLALAFVVAVGIALVVQDYSGAIPLGLFNEGREVYRLLSGALLAITLGAIGILGIDLLRGKGSRVAGAIRGALVAILLVELLLFVVDTTFLSSDRSSRIGGPYTERRSVSGMRVYLRKTHPGSPLGFRTPLPYPRVSDATRVLFLGDSYTEGSGQTLACNYPNAAENALREQLGMEVEVMNAGVGGYGPADSYNLLRFLTEEGYRFDAVVFNLFLENDFTDNLPGTERRVVAGINFRLPRSRFLRWFHPLNTRAFRFSLFVVRVGSLPRDEGRAFHTEIAHCVMEGEKLREVSSGLRTTVERRLAGSKRVAQTPAAREEVIRAIEKMRAETQRLGVPFALVLFPDRVLVDPRLRSLLALEPEQLRAPKELRAYIQESFPELPLIDVSSLLDGGTRLYRAADTHLSDRGNEAAGRFVGERLAELLAGSNFAGEQRPPR